jgi:hypothetical protein
VTTVNHETGEVHGDPGTLGPLDRYGPLENVSPKEAAMVMVRVQRMRRDQVAELKRLRMEVARLSAVAEKAKARAQLEAEGTVEDRKAKGRLDSADAFFDVACAQAVAEAAYAELFILRDDWDTCRSIGANERAEKNAIEGIGN